MKPLILGPAYGPRWDGVSAALGGRCGERLSWLFGVPLAELSRRFELANVLPFFPGKDGVGDAFPVHEARLRASGLRLGERPFVVLLGRNVARATGFPASAPFLSWSTLECGADALLLPHPSGLCRWWNDRDRAEAARRVCSALVSTAAGS